MAGKKDSVDSSFSSLEDRGIHLLMEEIDEDSSFEAIEFILEANLNKSDIYDHLTLIINSPGGSVTDGFALIDIMKGSRLPIHTVGVGMIASMGLLIFMSGEKGARSLTPNTMILSHQWEGVTYGKEHELIAARRKNDLITSKFIEHYRANTSLTESDIKKILLPESDVWLTAEEALNYGICDNIKYINKDNKEINHGKKKKI